MARRAEQLALHDEKRRAVADWVERRGTPDQRARHAAGVLPLEEVLEGMADEAFAIVGEMPRYIRDGVERLQAHLRQFADYANVVISASELHVVSRQADSVTVEQWALKQLLQTILPNAELVFRVHRLSWKTDPRAPALTQFGVLVTDRSGAFTLRREYLAVHQGDK
jgi:hypothetical protein